MNSSYEIIERMYLEALEKCEELSEPPDNYSLLPYEATLLFFQIAQDQETFF